MIPLIIHTCDAYSFCWDGFMKHFQENWDSETSNIFCNEEADIPYTIGQIKTGKSEWSDRLLHILDVVKTKYIFYIQEDMWIKEGIGDLDNYIKLMEENNLKCIHIAPDCQYYSYSKKTNTFAIFSNNSDYTLNHQPAIWDREFFISNLLSGETPWRNELDGTIRLNERGEGDKVGIVFKDWYNHVCQKGKLICQK